MLTVPRVAMSLQKIKQAIEDKKMFCPECKGSVQKYEKYADMLASVWDGPGDARMETEGSKVTLICGNCDWKERTEYWSNYIED